MAVTAGPDNSYATRAEADAYFETRLHCTAWTGASADDREAALVWATNLLDATFVWDGVAASPSSQPLLWPRAGLLDPFGSSVPSTEIPELLKRATAETAMALISSDRTADLATDGLFGVKVGSVNVRFAKPNAPPRRVVPDIVAEMLAIWGTPRRVPKTASVGGIVRLKRC